MEYSAGLLGIMNKLERKKLAKMQPDIDREVKSQMQAFCQSTASKYGIERGKNLLQLQIEIANSGYYYEELHMKNEDAAIFLEKEKEELCGRTNAMYNRIKTLPVEGILTPEKNEIKIGRHSGVSKESGPNERLSYAKSYIENTGLDFPTEEYLQRFYVQANCLIEETDKDIAILQKGLQGEAQVMQQLKLYEGKYQILSNIVLPSVDSMGESSEVDAYIITEKGVVVVEIKNFGNEKRRLHISSDGRWVIEDAYSGNILRRIDKSPVEQNARHCLALERLLKEKLGEECSVPVIPVVFIGNNKITIQNESKSAVLRASEFYTFINSLEVKNEVSREMQQNIEALLKKEDIGAREFGVKSRLQAMKSLEEMEAAFTKYVLYNDEIAREYPKIIEENRPEISRKHWWILAVPLAVILLFPELNWIVKVVLAIFYTVMLFSMSTAIVGTVVIFFFLLTRSFWKMLIGLLILGMVCGGFAEFTPRR